jgi:hypothetical protein
MTRDTYDSPGIPTGAGANATPEWRDLLLQTSITLVLPQHRPNQLNLDNPCPTSLNA